MFVLGVGTDNAGVLVLAATNIPWALDTAIRRRYFLFRKILFFKNLSSVVSKNVSIFHYLELMNEQLCLKLIWVPILFIQSKKMNGCN
jgi:AAA+ superfamily predicted ATPase